MTRAAQILVVIATSLWLGGLVALFLFVGALFGHDRTIAIQAAPPLFNVFAKYQLLVGLIGLIALFFWQASYARTPWTIVIMALLALSLALAAYVTFSVIPEMEAIRIAGQSGDSPRFKTLHGRSMIFYSSQTIAMLLAAMMLPSAITASARRARTGIESDPARDSPVATADRVAVR